jgi:hypothetical protein
MTKLMWVQTLLQELRVSSPPSARIWCDNIGASYLIENPVFHGRMKHMWKSIFTLFERGSQTSC